MSVSVKICGLKTHAAMEAALKGGADYVGFIFFPKSPRHIELDNAAVLADQARGRAKIVAVSVNADDAALDAIVAAVKPDYLQLHGGESPERVMQIKQRYQLPAIKAITIREAADLELIKPYRGIVDQFLFDAKPPAGSDLPGGNGVSFDWTILADLDDDVDYMLSGGLDAANITAALQLTGTDTIDLSSGVESAPGVKDTRLIAEFFDAVKRAEQRPSA